MRLPIPSIDRCAVPASALLACAVVLAQEASLEPVALPESARALPAAAESLTVASAAAAGVEEIIVEGRSNAVLRERLVIAQDKFYSVFNEINTIDEFDIHCRMHATTGTRIPQRICLPNFEDRLNAEKGQAVLAALRGEAFGTDWQSPESEMQNKIAQLQEHMQQLAREHPELIEAMAELYEAMQAAEPRRHGPEAEEP